MMNYMQYFDTPVPFQVDPERYPLTRRCMSLGYGRIKTSVLIQMTRDLSTSIDSDLCEQYMHQTPYRDLLQEMVLTPVAKFKKGKYRLADRHPQLFIFTLDSLSMSARSNHEFGYIVHDTEYTIDDIIDFAVIRAYNVPKPMPLNVNNVISMLNEKFKTHRIVKVKDPRDDIPGSKMMDEYYPSISALRSARHYKEYNTPKADLELRFLKKYWEQV